MSNDLFLSCEISAFVKKNGSRIDLNKNNTKLCILRRRSSIYGWAPNLISPFLLHQVLRDGIPKYQSPPDMSLITCLAMTNDCNVIAYGCYNGSVRLYYLDSSAVKTLGSHQEKVIDLAVNIEIMPDTQMEMVVVVSGKVTRILDWPKSTAFQVFHQNSKSNQTY